MWFVRYYMAVDLRWLGLFRIAFGLLLCTEVVRRWLAAPHFFTNAGLLPNHYSLFQPPGPGTRYHFSLYHAFSTLPQVSVAFGLTLLVFLAYVVGWKTRWAQVLAFVCITSLNARNFLVENGGSVAVNLLALWTLFLPLGSRLSLDALVLSLKQRRESTAPELNASPSEGSVQIYRLAMFGLLLQWSLIYFFNVVHKSGVGWRNGSALHWFLHQDRIVTAVGVLIRQHASPLLLQGSTYAALAAEAALAVLLLIPFRQRATRLLALGLALLLHGGIALTARLGSFSYVMTLFFLLVLSGADYEWLVRRVRGKRRPLRVIFDGDCGVCFQICRILARLDGGRHISFQTAAECEPPPRGLVAADFESSVVAVDSEEEAHLGIAALIQIVDRLPMRGLGASLVLRLPGVRQLCAEGYRAFAARRHIVSAAMGWGTCGVAPPGPRATDARAELPSGPQSPASQLSELVGRAGGFLRTVATLCVFVMVGIQVLHDNAFSRRLVHTPPPLPTFLAAPMHTFRLYQGWRMFAPEPPYEDGRLVVDGRTVDGRQIDPLTGRPPDFTTDAPAGWGHDQYWCDFHLKMVLRDFSGYRRYLPDYLKGWHLRTGRDNDRLVAFDVWWVPDRSPPPGEHRTTPMPLQKVSSFGRVKDSGAPVIDSPASR